MYKWHEKDYRNFWLWMARHTPRKLIMWCVINEVARYMAANPTIHVDSVGAMDLTKFIDSDRV